MPLDIGFQKDSSLWDQLKSIWKGVKWYFGNRGASGRFGSAGFFDNLLSFAKPLAGKIVQGAGQAVLGHIGNIFGADGEFDNLDDVFRREGQIITSLATQLDQLNHLVQQGYSVEMDRNQVAHQLGDHMSKVAQFDQVLQHVNRAQGIQPDVEDSGSQSGGFFDFFKPSPPLSFIERERLESRKTPGSLWDMAKNAAIRTIVPYKDLRAKLGVYSGGRFAKRGRKVTRKRIVRRKRSKSAPRKRRAKSLSVRGRSRSRSASRPKKMRKRRVIRRRRRTA